ncbi:hypothetical protein ACFOMD_12295 [Sphingoaurantiacus capsulatus]|uniref:Uncharacterized protein n=1 Tax=Sphingoaurantiacus capsulatus TaxID=1771310 RepID=A0ABV7XDM4_9SPHN
MKMPIRIGLTLAGLFLAIGGSLLFGLHPIVALAILFGGASPLLFAGQ